MAIDSKGYLLFEKIDDRGNTLASSHKIDCFGWLIINKSVFKNLIESIKFTITTKKLIIKYKFVDSLIMNISIKKTIKSIFQENIKFIDSINKKSITKRINESIQFLISQRRYITKYKFIESLIFVDLLKHARKYKFSETIKFSDNTTKKFVTKRLISTITFTTSIQNLLKFVMNKFSSKLRTVHKSAILKLTHKSAKLKLLDGRDLK